MTDTATTSTAPTSDTPAATSIVATPTTVAPLTDTSGNTYVVQVSRGTMNDQPTNAASWNHNSDGSLDIYDINGALVASYLPGVAQYVQLIRIPSAPATD